MYERHKRRYSLCAKGERPVDVVLIKIHRDKDTSYPLSLSACPQPHTSQRTGSSQSTVFPSLSLSSSVGSSAHRDSGSDSESLLSAEPGDDNVFRKCDDVVTCGDSTSEVSVSCSSTDDTASVGPPSSSPDSCLEGQTQALGTWTPEESTRTGVNTVPGLGFGGEAGGAGETEEEAKDRVTEVVPTRRSALLLRSSLRSLSPLRRHSWGPGKNATGGGGGGDADMNQRSTLRSPGEGKPTFHRRSYSLEGLSGEQDTVKGPCSRGSQRGTMLNNEEERGGGSLVSLTEEQEDAGEHGNMEEQRTRRYRPLRHSCPPLSLPLTKSVSMLTISQKDIEASGQQHRKRRVSFSFNLSPSLLTKVKSHFHVDSPSSDDEDSLSMRSLSSTTGSLDYSISEEEPGPLRTDFDGKSSTKVGRTFSYLKSKMYKKTREKDKETKDKKSVNGHLFTAVSSGQAAHCTHCNKAFNNKDAFHCTHCHSYVHKSCRESLPVCAKVKMKFTKHQLAVPDSSSIAAAVTMRNKSSGTRERPWSAILLPDDHSSLAAAASRRHTSMMAFHSSNLSKSISISNIAGPVLDEMPIKGLRYLSQSTDSLNRNSHVTESTESLTDEGTEMMDGQLMGEFEAEVKDLEFDSWSLTVEQDLLKQLNTELIKRQDVIYELMQTEMHHVRTLRIMSEVYSKGLQKEVGLEPQTLDRLFPALDELLDLHTQHLHRLLERRRDNQEREDNPGGGGGGFIVNRIGDVLLHQFSGSSAECMKRVYGKFCSRHNEAVNLYKELLTKDKRFQAFIKRKMSSSVVRRLGIPECILLVTQRITKYPGLILRMLQHTKESEEDFEDLNEAVRLVKEVITAVDDKVNEHEKRQRLKDIHARTDSKSIMRMRSGQMFAREDLLRGGRRHIHDGPLQLKNTQGRLKDVHALLLSDVFVFLQEKDQKYVFASLDHRSTVLSLQKLIVREVANEERGLFLITVGSDRPEMVEVLASSRDERNTWIQLVQDAMHCIEKDDDEGIPSETEEDKRLLETKAKEMRDLLRQKDEQIVTLLEEKARVFREMCECGGGDAAAGAGGVGGGGAAASRGEGAEQRDGCCPAEASLFRAASGSQEALPRGEPIMKHALQEVETLQTLVNGSLGGAMAVGGQQDGGGTGGGGGGVGPVCLPRRAETFGGFDSHQMNSKSGDRDESGDTAADLRRTESDSVLKKGGNANLLLLLKRNSEQVLHSVSHLHDLLSALQAVVVQQDSVIEDQRQVLVLSNSSTSNNNSSSSSSTAPSSRPSSRPNSLIEQEKQRSLEKHRQELASLQRQQSAHAEERRRREKEWERTERELMDREVLLHVQDEETGRRRVELEREREELQGKKEEYQRDLERLRDAQRKLERDRDTLQRERDRVAEGRTIETTTSEDSLHHHPADGDLPELFLLSSSSPPRLQPTAPRKSQSLPRGKSLNPFTSSSSSSNSSSSHQMPGRLLQLASKNKDKDKDKKEKKKKKKKEGKGGTTDSLHLEGATLDGEIFFC